MIYSTLKGGLGNMMFEIAAMCSLAYDNNDNVCFINISSQIAYLNNETNFNPNMQHAQEYDYLLKRFDHPTPDSYVKQFNMPFHFEKLEYVNGAFYDGFFQSEKWFAHNRHIILNILKPSYNIIKTMQSKYSHILELPNSVAIHVRRGDYVKNQQNHALMSEDYFKTAVSHFDINSNFVIFSDDILWCKEFFKMPNTFFIENEKDYVEIYLMANMHNCIISNSSFGWWGAWLNCNVDKKIIAPSIWFGPNIKHNTSDIIPVSWTKI